MYINDLRVEKKMWLISVVACLFSLVAVILNGLMQNSSSQLQRLYLATLVTQSQIDLVTNEIATLNNTALLKYEQFRLCIDTGNSQCSNITESYLSIQTRIEEDTAESLNVSLSSTNTHCQQLINETLLRIITPNANTTTVLQSGTLTVTVNDTTTSATYIRYNLHLGSDFDLPYLVIEPWSLLVDLSGDFQLTFTDFSPPIPTGSATNGKIPLLNIQKERFSVGLTTWERSYNGNVIMYGNVIASSFEQKNVFVYY